MNDRATELIGQLKEEINHITGERDSLMSHVKRLQQQLESMGDEIRTKDKTIAELSQNISGKPIQTEPITGEMNINAA